MSDVTQAVNQFARRHAGFLVFAVVVMTIPAYLGDAYYLSVLAFMAPPSAPKSPP